VHKQGTKAEKCPRPVRPVIHPCPTSHSVAPRTEETCVTTPDATKVPFITPSAIKDPFMACPKAATCLGYADSGPKPPPDTRPRFSTPAPDHRKSTANYHPCRPTDTTQEPQKRKSAHARTFFRAARYPVSRERGTRATPGTHPKRATHPTGTGPRIPATNPRRPSPCFSRPEPPRRPHHNNTAQKPSPDGVKVGFPCALRRAA
jgi:hypothetical protein